MSIERRVTQNMTASEMNLQQRQVIIASARRSDARKMWVKKYGKNAGHYIINPTGQQHLGVV